MGTFIHGIAASENIDSAGERLSIAGMDISSLEKDGVFNYEHEIAKIPDKDGRPIEMQIKIPAQVVGKILKARKIFSEKDCEDEFQLHFWQKVLTPYLYVMGELFDDYTEAAKDLAGKFRYDLDHKDQNKAYVNNFSIEGGKLEKQGMDVPRSVARKVTITVTPCNKAAVAEMVPAEMKQQKPDIDSLFKTEAEIFDGEALMKSGFAKKPAPLSLVPKINPLGSLIGTVGKLNIMSHAGPQHFASATAQELRGISSKHYDAATAAQQSRNQKLARHHMDQVKRFMQAADRVEARQSALPKDPNVQPTAPVAPPTPGRPTAPASQEYTPPTLFDPRRSGKITPPGPIKKSLDAGSGMAAPEALTGGAVLAKEDLSKKKKKSTWLARAEAEYKSWNKREFFEKFMSERMPNLTKGEIVAIGQVIALNKSMNIEQALASIANLNAPPKRITQVDPMNKAAGKDSIYVLILFEGCDLYDILHFSHFATDDINEGTFEKITKVCDEYFKGGVKSHELKFNDSGELGKEGQSVLFLSEGDPYQDLFDKLKEVAEYKYPVFKPHISVTSNVDHFTGKAAHLVISVDGEIKRTYDFSHKDKIPGGLADKKKPSDFDPKKLAEGIKVESEHTSDLSIAEEIAMDHLTEDPEYYEKLKTIEKK